MDAVDAKKPMKRCCVLHIIATNFFGGPEKQIVKHCASMDSQKWRMIVCSYMEGKPKNELLDRAKRMELETYALNTASAYNPFVIWELYDLLKQIKPDVIVAHGYRPLIPYLLLKPFHKKPIIGYSRGYTAENLKIKLYEKCHRVSLRFSDLIIAVSEGHKRVLVNYGLTGDKIEVVHNAVSVDEQLRAEDPINRSSVCKLLGVPNDSAIVVSAGRLSPEKGHRFLIEAIGMLCRSSNNTHFIFCGDGPCQKDLEKRSKELGISDLCHFVGFRKDIKDIFQAMDFMVLPSLTEGLPNVILEAFACAKPVVAADVGGVPEIVEDGVNGILVPPGRSDLLAEAIKNCLIAPEKRRKMGEAGYQKVKSEFTFESQTKKLENIYYEVLTAVQQNRST